ncbi:MAG: OmpA family protein [Spirochaetes bacterium]|nr:OmpA family protein [Spirochaetota bacterium]
MAVKKRPKSKPRATPGWMLTMGDMNNLLLCFFIVLMGEETIVKGYEFLYVLSSFKGNVGIMAGGKSISKGNMMELGHNIAALPSTERQQYMSRILKRAVEAFKPEIESKYVRVREDERGLVITLSGDVFFDPGSARLRGEVRPIIGKLGKIIRNVDNFVRIEGHTDNTPITPARAREAYRTNWELSSARAINVLHYLTDEAEVSPKQLSAVAFGEYRPIDDNDTPQGRAYNRRVDIVILKERFIQPSADKRIPRPLPDEEWR